MTLYRLKTRGRPDGKIKVFAARVVQSGWVQKAFKEQIGDDVGECVKKKVVDGMTPKEIHDAVKDCAPAKGSIKLKRPSGRKKRKR